MVVVVGEGVKNQNLQLLATALLTSTVVLF